MAKKPKKKLDFAFLHRALIPSRVNGNRPHAFRHFMLSIYSFGLILSQVAFGITYISPVATNPNQLQNEVFNQINAERSKVGETSLTENSVLNKAAKQKLEDMFQKNYWDHTSPSGEKAWNFINELGYKYSSAGENLAKGFVTSSTMVSAWMASPSHKKNILDKDFSQTGIAVGNGEINGSQVTLAVQLFAEPSQALAASPKLVAGEKSVSPSFSLENPLLPGKGPYFVLYGIIFALLIFDGVMIRMNKEHKNKKSLNRFRFSLGINVVLLAFLALNIRSIF